jgi:hypothetical protein
LGCPSKLGNRSLSNTAASIENSGLRVATELLHDAHIKWMA